MLEILIQKHTVQGHGESNPPCSAECNIFTHLGITSLIFTHLWHIRDDGCAAPHGCTTPGCQSEAAGSSKRAKAYWYAFLSGRFVHLVLDQYIYITIIILIIINHQYIIHIFEVIDHDWLTILLVMFCCSLVGLKKSPESEDNWCFSQSDYHHFSPGSARVWFPKNDWGIHNGSTIIVINSAFRWLLWFIMAITVVISNPKWFIIGINWARWLWQPVDPKLIPAPLVETTPLKPQLEFTGSTHFKGGSKCWLYLMDMIVPSWKLP